MLTHRNLAACHAVIEHLVTTVQAFAGEHQLTDRELQGLLTEVESRLMRSREPVSDAPSTRPPLTEEQFLGRLCRLLARVAEELEVDARMRTLGRGVLHAVRVDLVRTGDVPAEKAP